jgi:methyl coenzyme M reductase subunit C
LGDVAEFILTKEGLLLRVTNLLNVISAALPQTFEDSALHAFADFKG